MNIRDEQKGFSLVELGITLSIIAMIIAAVVAGTNLKDKLELNQVIEDIGNISEGVKEFKTIYNGYPGDMFDAQDKFGWDNTNGGTDGGDGDNQIETSATGAVNQNGSTGTVNETTLFWQHLAIAGLLEGSYNGTSDVMESPISKGLYTVSKNSTESVVITLGKVNSPTHKRGLLTTKAAWELDTKFDDGKPTTGVLQAELGSDHSAGDCINTTPDPDEYNVSNTGESPCVMNFFIE
jgi:prepilin-type N-terminal cleavage/methylation domain-containing protein